MKTKGTIIILILALIGTTVAFARKSSRKKRSHHTSTAAVQGISSVTLRRGACFGRCPEYAITIKNDGSAEYRGFRNADPMGVYQKNIGVQAAQDLIKEFTDMRVDTCSAVYFSRIADMPGLNFSFILNGKEQKVENAQFGPLYFITLGDEMDRLGKPDANWKKISNDAVN